MPPDLDKFLAVAEDLADLARNTVLEAYPNAIDCEIKADGSPVTTVDRAVEERLRERITALFPDHGILGDEVDAVGLDREFLWVLDPIDGTKAFAAGLPDFGSLIALCHQGEPVIGVIELPLLGRRCLGVKGRPTTFDGSVVRCRERTELASCVLSSSGPDAFRKGGFAGFEGLRARTAWNVYSAGCVSYVSLARGLVDICLEGNLDPYDFCALVPVIQGAGGTITDWRGERLTLQSGPRVVACGTGGLHDQVLAVLGEHDAP